MRRASPPANSSSSCNCNERVTVTCRAKTLFWSALLALAVTNTFAGQGVGGPLYAMPNSGFVENPSGDSLVTVYDASGSIPTLQTAINNGRSANPSALLVIHLLSGATYSVTNAGLVL